MTRLQAVCSLVTAVNVFADIGCDHGYVSKYAHEIGCKTVIASDVSQGSVDKAKSLLSGLNGVKTVCCDGFDAIDESVDLAVISGMGGQKIIEIVSRAKNRPETLVLGPQHDVHVLRKYLTQNGYYIDADFLVEENGKYYDVIRAKKGESKPLTFTQLYYGAHYEKKNATLLSYALAQCEKMKRYAKTPLNEQKLNALKEIIKWQR